MILIFGGAYQGKRDFAEQLYARRTGGEGTAVVSTCPPQEPGAPDFSADIICGLENFTWACCTEEPESRIEAKDWMQEHRALWKDKILIITDVSQGIVPMDARTRAFREMNGRLMLYLASEADEVWRVFCGIGKPLR